MPISGNATYLTTADTFISHWTSANGVLGAAGPVLTATGLDVAGLGTLRSAVDAQLLATTDSLNTVEITRDLLATRKNRVRQLIGAFNEAVRGRLANTAMPAGLPAVPGARDSAITTSTAADDAASLWLNVNGLAAIPGFTAPLVLRVPPAGDADGSPAPLALAAFQAALANLKTLTTDLRGAEQRLVLTRQQRDHAKKHLYDALRDYRAAIPGYFPPGDPIRESLPALNPPPGSTPAPVTAAATWDPATSQARITFSASTAATLDHYELRYGPGADYSTDDEITIASLSGGGALLFHTLTGLPTPGTTAHYRVYVITETGNESGSNTVTVTRPA